MEEKTNLTQEELMELIAQGRRLNCMEEYYAIKKELLYKVERVLELRDVLQRTVSNNKKTKRIINKYAKTYKKEKDVNKVLESMEEQEDAIGYNYVSAVIALMYTTHKVLFAETFYNELPPIDIWYDFEMEDMILVNDLIKQLRHLDSSNVTVDDILEALNYAIYKYSNCLKNNIEYTETFEKSFPFVKIEKVEQGKKDE